MAIRITSERVDLTYVERNLGQRPAVMALDSKRNEGNTAEILAHFYKQFKLARYRCMALLSQSEYQLLQVEAPNVPEEELREAVRWQIKEMVDYPVQAATIDVLDIPGEGSGNGRAKSIFVIAANNSVISDQMGIFGNARVPLKVIDIPEIAQRNIASLYEEENRGLAFLVFDEAGGLLTFTYRGELCAVRRIELTSEQIIAADVSQREQYLERIVLELQRSLDNFDRQYSFISLSRLLILPLPALPGLASYLAANLDTPVDEISLEQVLDFPSLPELKSPMQQAQYLPVIGVALRQEVAA